MTSDWGADFAAELTDYLSQGVDLPTAPGTVYVTLYDDTGTELNADLQNGRVAVTTGAGFNEPTPTSFENANQVDFGEVTAGSVITVDEFAIKDADADDATATELVRAKITDNPQKFADKTQVFFDPGELTVDVLE